MIESPVCSTVARRRIGWGNPGSRPAADGGGVADRSRIRIWEYLGWLLMIGLLIVGLRMAYQRAIDKGPDLAGFCDAGRYILRTRHAHARFHFGPLLALGRRALDPVCLAADFGRGRALVLHQLRGMVRSAANDLRPHIVRS